MKYTLTPLRLQCRFQPGSIPGLFCSLVLAAILCVVPAFGQGGGSITGRVLDGNSGKYLEGAEVSVQGTDQRVSTARAGSFSIPNLAPGSYTIVVTYPGLEEKTETVAVSAGQPAEVVVRLDSADVIKLGEFKVQGSKEGMSQAVALQKLSIQTKLVAAADQFGPISEGNIGEYLKYLPGLSIDYNANDARGVSLRGLNTSFTVVAVDGTPMAASSSTADTRRFEFEQIAMNNVETTELYKTVTPDIPASATGGFVNFVTKSAFDREDPMVLSYDFNLVVPSTNFSFGKKSGVWGDKKEFVIRPNLDLNYAQRIGSKIGINFNYRTSERYDDSPRTEINWAQTGAASSSLWTAPVMEQYNIRTEQKLTHREAFATKLDYNISESTKLTLSGQWNWYDLHFHQRGPLLILGTAATATRSGPNENPTFTSTAPIVRNDVLYRNKYGTTLHFNGTLNHDFGQAGKAWATAYWSYADGQYRDIQKGFVGSTAQLNAGVITSMTLANSTTNDIPALSFMNGTNPVSVDAIRQLSNYSLSASQANSNLQARPWTTHDNKKGISAHYQLPIPGLEAVPVTVQTGFAIDKTERDITRIVLRQAPGSTLSVTDLTPYLDTGFTKDVGFDFGSYQAVDPYKIAAAFGSSMVTPQEDTYRDITEDNTAYYVRLDVKPIKDLLVIGGVRWEEHKIDGYGINRALNNAKRAPVNLKYDKLYPSLSFKYTPSYLRSFVARGGISKTVGHPDYADLIGSVTSESTAGSGNGSITLVDPNMQPYYTTNTDLSVDYYLKNSGVITLSVFRKQVKNFIASRSMTLAERNAAVIAAGYNPAEFSAGNVRYNGPDSSVQGLELNYAQTLSFLPKPFNGLNVQLNYTMSDVDGDSNDVLWAQQRGSAPKTFNAIIGYRYRKFSFTSSTNWTDDTVASGLVNSEWIRGAANADPNLDTQLVSIKDSVWRTDMKAEYAFSPRYKVYVAVQNVFGAGRYDYWHGYTPNHSQVNLPRNHFQFGEPYYNVGIRGTF
ncbi:MAG: TonB-dependent receptor [Nibricoccus sp.]